MQKSDRWFYFGARLAATGEWVGWLGASTSGNVQFFGSETDDPSTISGVEYVGFQPYDGKTILRAPNYHIHDSAYLGGSELQGYFASWKWTQGGGYGVELGGDGVLKDETDRLLSLYKWGTHLNASWEHRRGDTTTLTFSLKPAEV